MRRNIVAGNWKMNKTFSEGLDLAKALVAGVMPNDTLVILGTPMIHLKAVSELLEGAPTIELAAQNCHHKKSGAYTGETSVNMLLSVGVHHVILGHSERREYFSESNELLAEKVNLVLSKDLKPIFCCGESLAIRESGSHVNFVANQLKESLFHLSDEDFSKVVIAYEPIWAIGTGVTASPEQAQEMHAEIRKLISNQYGEAIADDTSILYGGSVKPANAEILFSQPDVDGGLVGGASLKVDDFLAIINAFA